MAASNPRAWAGFPDERAFAAHLARLERYADDRRVDDELRAGRARDALAGNVLPRHVYRLACGHLLAINGHPLPRDAGDLYCTGHGDQGPALADPRLDHPPGYRPVVEHLTDY